jgi:hypothetical protein
MLHGVTVDQVLTMPIIGLSKSASCMPAARKYERAAARFGPAVTAALRALGFLGWEVEFCVIGPVRFEPPSTKNPASFRERGGARRS